jgi:hypothetical protein
LRTMMLHSAALAVRTHSGPELVGRAKRLEVGRTEAR